jgi:hypothetical protein
MCKQNQFFKFIHLFICAFIAWTISPFCPPLPPSSPTLMFPLLPFSQPDALIDMGSILGPRISIGIIHDRIWRMAILGLVLQSAMTRSSRSSNGLVFGFFTNFFHCSWLRPSCLPPTSCILMAFPQFGFWMNSGSPGFSRHWHPTTSHSPSLSHQ